MTHTATPETLRAATRLLRHVEWSEGFWLGYVFTVAPPQAHVLQERVGVLLATRGRRQQVLRPNTPTELELALESILAEPNAGCTWLEAIREHGARSGAWTRAWINLTLRINERRELIRERLAGGLVFVAHPEVKPDLRTAGPDLWSIRSLTFEIPAGDGRAEEPFSPQHVVDDFDVELMDKELLASELRRMPRALLTLQPDRRAGFLQRYSDLFWESGRWDDAVHAETEALGIFRRLAAQNRALFTPEVARSLDRLALRLSWMGQQHAAVDAAADAVKLYREMAATRPDECLPKLGHALVSFGLRLHLAGRSQDALAAAEEAVQLCRSLAASDPSAYVPELASSLATLGTLLAAAGRRREAVTIDAEAEALIRQLADDSPDAHLPKLAVILMHFGSHLFALGRREEAVETAEEALSLCRVLAAEQPRKFNPLLARGLGWLGHFRRELGQFEASLDLLAEALRIMEEPYRRLPAGYQSLFDDLVSHLETTCKEGGLTPPSDLQHLLDSSEPKPP